MINKKSDTGYQQVADGIDLKTLVYGEKTLMVEFKLKKNAIIPIHSHPHEQTGYLVKGQIKLTMGKDSNTFSAGDSWCIAEGMEHGAETLEDSVVVEVFSPVREDYLPSAVK